MRLSDSAVALTPKESRLFLAEPARARGVRSLADQARFMSEYVEAQLGSASIERPQPLAMGDSPGHHKGGLVVWHRDVFPLDLFAKSRDSAPTSAQAIRSAQAAPWFEWRPETREFVLHRSGAQERLLELLKSSVPGPNFTLHRGSTPYEATVCSLRKALAGGAPLPADWRASLLAGLDQLVGHAREGLQAWEGLSKDGYVTAAEVEEKRKSLARAEGFRGERVAKAESVRSEQQAAAFLDDSLARFARDSFFGGLFATVDADRAALFSKGRVLHYELPAATLASLVRAGRAYIGLEKIGDDVSVELGFFGATRGGGQGSDGPDGVQALTGAFRDATEESSGQLFN